MSNPYEQKAREIVGRIANVEVGQHRFGSAEELLTAIAAALREAVEAEKQRCAALAYSTHCDHGSHVVAKIIKDRILGTHPREGEHNEMPERTNG